MSSSDGEFSSRVSPDVQRAFKTLGLQYTDKLHVIKEAIRKIISMSHPDKILGYNKLTREDKNKIFEEYLVLLKQLKII